MTVIGLNEASQTLTDRVGRHGKAHLPAARAKERGLFSDRVENPGGCGPDPFGMAFTDGFRA